MERPYLFLVKCVEALGFEHFAHAYPNVLYTWLIMAIIMLVSFIATKSINMVPGKMQNLFEMIISSLEDFMAEMAGDESRWLFPLLGTIFIFILVSNLSGLIPGFFPPTASVETNAAMAVIVVVFTHVIGFKYHGIKYYKHFMGPVWWLSWLILPIELIGHLARMLSLTLRLLGNIAGHELVLGILFGLAGAFFVPLPIMAMGIFVSLVQAFVFFMLSLLYFSAAMEHAH